MTSVNKITFNDINGKEITLGDARGKILVVVNTASECGFTDQYKELQELSDKYSQDQLTIVAIPSNDFGKQEPGTKKEIKEFCESKYGITFPIMDKNRVVGPNRHHFYTWVEAEYGTDKLPVWNFHKYIIDKSSGKMLYSIPSKVSPTSQEFINNIDASLK
jgi:glutathione peroxidase